ncbi:MAG: DUF6390 family protein [Thermomicrobiales bacterium]
MFETVNAPPTSTLTPPNAIAGTARFVRYAFMPNRLSYCGGDDNRAIFDYALATVREPPLEAMLRKFSGAMPYLTLIARGNDIADPFDDRVVEAYWIGNELLDRVRVGDLYASLRDRYRTQLSPRLMELVAAKAPAGARPHHSFHVFDVWRNVDRLSGDVLATLDNCRISWGTVLSVEGGELLVERRPLVMQDGKLVLADARPERVVRQIDGRGFAEAAQPGDAVSLHWGWVCEVLSPRQRASLERFTLEHVALANQTI